MEPPSLSSHFQTREPSSIRLAQIEFLKRTDGCIAVNTAIGNVSLPMHPAMVKRMHALDAQESPFQKGVVKYSTTCGEKDANQTFLHLIETSGFSTKGLYSQITDGGSAAMELMILGTGGKAGSMARPILLIAPVYSNYISLAERTGRSYTSILRYLQDNGEFTFPSLEEIETIIQKERPSAVLVIPYDNPTGQFLSQQLLCDIGKLCVKYNLWFISDEAYREIFYTKDTVSSIWGVTEQKVPGIQGRRISIESASKTWNACGLRIGALITDNEEFHGKAVAENTANLCANVLGQYIFSALLKEPKEKLQDWFSVQRQYYTAIAQSLSADFKQRMPGLIVSSCDAALYTVVDVRNLCDAKFDANEFVLYCAKQGYVQIDRKKKTLLVAPMIGFYDAALPKNPGRTQMRIAYVEPPDVMAQVPLLFSQLFADFIK